VNPDLELHVSAEGRGESFVLLAELQPFPPSFISSFVFFVFFYPKWGDLGPLDPFPRSDTANCNYKELRLLTVLSLHKEQSEKYQDTTCKEQAYFP